jgi:hypothetical protein
MTDAFTVIRRTGTTVYFPLFIAYLPTVNAGCSPVTQELSLFYYVDLAHFIPRITGPFDAVG